MVTEAQVDTIIMLWSSRWYTVTRLCACQNVCNCCKEMLEKKKKSILTFLLFRRPAPSFSHARFNEWLNLSQLAAKKERER